MPVVEVEEKILPGFLGIFGQDYSVMTFKVFEIGFIHSVTQTYGEFLKLFDKFNL